MGMKKKDELQELEKIMLTPASNDQMMILMITEYEGYHYLIQRIGQLKGRREMYQYIIFDPKKKQWYQTYITIKAEPKEPLLNRDVMNALVTVQKMAEATITALIRKENPKYSKSKSEKEYEQLAQNIISKMIDDEE